MLPHFPKGHHITEHGPACLIWQTSSHNLPIKPGLWPTLGACDLPEAGFVISCWSGDLNTTPAYTELYKPSYLTLNKKANELCVWLFTATPCKQTNPEWSPRFIGPHNKQAVPHKFYSALISSGCFLLCKCSAGLPNKWAAGGSSASDSGRPFLHLPTCVFPPCHTHATQQSAER